MFVGNSNEKSSDGLRTPISAGAVAANQMLPLG